MSVSTALDVRKVRITYSKAETHDLYIGTFLYTNCGKVSVSVDGAATTHDLYLAEFGGTTANRIVMAANNTAVLPGGASPTAVLLGVALNLIE